MGLINSNKEVSVKQINQGDTFTVKLSLAAEPDIINNPKDIALILDRSSSMLGDPFLALQKGANHFIDIIDQSTDNKGDGEIGFGSRIGIVSFSGSANIDKQLSTSVSELKSTVNALNYGGSTNHEDAFTKALELLDNTSTNEKVMVMFTDGVSNTGKEGINIAKLAKAKGIIIYCILLGNANNLDMNVVNQWASEPSSAFILNSPSYSDIDKMFADLAENISKPGATNINLVDTINDCFEIVGVKSITKGTTEILSPTSIRWHIDELGAGTQAEGASLEFIVRDKKLCLGNVKVNKSYAYSDDENNVISLPEPTIKVVENKEEVVVIMDTNKYDVVIDGCSDYKSFDAGDISISGLGRILDVSVNIKDICPNKRVALGVVVSEKDAGGVEHNRGMKTFLIPAHSGATCQDVQVKCIRFVLPEELDETGNTGAICNDRNFSVKILANYVDSDYVDCNN